MSQLSQEEQRQAAIFNDWAEKDYLQSTIDPDDVKGLKCDYIHRWSRHYIQKFVLTDRPQTVLEIGCGSGRNLFMLAPRLKHAYGVDIAEKQIQNAEAKKQQLGVQNASFYTHQDDLFQQNPAIDVAFTMWVIAGFATDDQLVAFLSDYLQHLPATNRFIFFEQVAQKTHPVYDRAGEFFKKVRTREDFQEIFRQAGLQVQEFHILSEKGFGVLYRKVYHSRIYKYLPVWLNLNPILFALDRWLVQRRIHEKATDSVFVCTRLP